MVLMCQCRFVDCKKYSIQYEILIVEEVVLACKEENMGTSVLSTQFCYELKTSLKLKYIRKKRKGGRKRLRK